jgi:DNA-binding NtrC family response regulator
MARELRELRNAIERAMILCEGGLITGEHLPITLAGAARPAVTATVAGPAPAAPQPATPIPAGPIPPEGLRLTRWSAS